MNQPHHINKEDLIKLRFPKQDVLLDLALVGQREKDLGKALSLGNNDHVKVKMTFLDCKNDIYEIETTIWAVTKEHICLKGDLLLPKSALLTIEFI